jgi:hypothetical protein
MTPDPCADLAESMVPVACDLACRVRDGDVDGIGRLAESLTMAEVAALIVVLAAMVPVEDASPNDLLAWTGDLGAIVKWRQAQLPLAAPGRPVTEPCGTYAAWSRHRRRGEPSDRACDEARRVYTREQVRAYRARKADRDAA